MAQDSWKNNSHNKKINTDFYKKGIEIKHNGKIRVVPRLPETIYQNFDEQDICNGDIKKAS